MLLSVAFKFCCIKIEILRFEDIVVILLSLYLTIYCICIYIQVILNGEWRMKNFILFSCYKMFLISFEMLFSRCCCFIVMYVYFTHWHVPYPVVVLKFHHTLNIVLDLLVLPCRILVWEGQNWCDINSLLSNPQTWIIK